MPTQPSWGQGIGRALYAELFERLNKLAVHAVIGGIALPNERSIALHESFGMKKVAHFERVGFKFGTWVDVANWQQLKASLPDAAQQSAAPGSVLQLDTATQIQVRLYRDRREVHLQSGQAMFAVHSDPQRPLHVVAGALHITVVGTRFSVRHTGTGLDAGQTVVAVEEGRVRVERRRPGADSTDGTEAPQDLAASTGAPADHPVELTAGQAVVADAQGRIGPVATLATNAIAPWRDGRLSFDQTPLAQAIAEFERYGRTGLVVRDPAVAALPVGGSYSLQQWRRFAETLPQVLPVRLVRRGEVTEVVAR
jgi:transmembrane sensor